MHNKDCTCWNYPAIDLAGKVDFRACGQSVEDFRKRMGLERYFPDNGRMQKTAGIGTV